MDTYYIYIAGNTKACSRRRTFHEPNLMQMSSNKDFRSLTLGSVHVKFRSKTGLKQA